MYGIAGERRLDEWEVPLAAGLSQTRRRCGSATPPHSQLQLDVYGEVMDALHQARRGGLGASDDGWAVQIAFLEHLRERLDGARRGHLGGAQRPPQHFTYSKVMAWVAFDRAIKSAEELRPRRPGRALARAARRDPRRGVPARASTRQQNSFVQSYGRTELDASLLLLPMVGFLPPDDPRVIGTVEAIERDLMVDGFVRRYDTARSEDGLPPGEGVFLACSFWLVDAYVMLGRMRRGARAVRAAGRAAQRRRPAQRRVRSGARGELLGNFPQAFSHVALVNSAFNLDARVEAGRAARRSTRRAAEIGPAPARPRHRRAPARPRQRRDEARAPMLDVVLRQHLDSAAVARLALVERHRQRLVDAAATAS